MPVLDSSSLDSPELGPKQRKAVAGMLSEMSPAAGELGARFASQGHELALVGGPVRDFFLGRPRGDLDLATDATPARVLEIVSGWADAGWTIGIKFGTGGLRAAMTGLAPRLAIVSAERISAELSKLMLAPLAGGPRRGIALLVDTGVAGQVLPEVPKLRLERDEHYRHKDVYLHSLTVLDQAIDLEPRYELEPDLVLRLAALLHDIGKPKTRTRLSGGRVAFHHHEVVGAKLARARLTALRFPKDVAADVARLVELHLRFHGYGTGEWTDSAVRRYVRDAGPLLTRLHALTRADCTTRNAAKAQRLARAYDSLEERIAALAEREELASIRPDLGGNEIMAILAIKPGPLFGKPYAYLLELRLEHGPLGPERATHELLAWAVDGGLDVPGSPPAAG